MARVFLVNEQEAVLTTLARFWAIYMVSPSPEIRTSFAKIGDNPINQLKNKLAKGPHD
jgi:hypothetical protein